MTATTHSVIGSLIAARFTDPFASVPIAFAAHYLLDVIPHWDSATNRRDKSEKRLVIESLIDLGIGIIASGAVYYYVFDLTNFNYLYLIVFVSLLPDIMTILTRFVFKKRNILWDWNNALQIKLNHRMQLPWGALTQIAAVGVVYVILFTIFI